MIRKCMTVAVALAAIGFTGIGNLQAFPIEYVEPPDPSGDLSNNPLAPTGLGALEVGVNTITGHLCGSNDPGVACFLPDERDAFDASLPAGLRITSVTFTVSDFSGSNAAGFVSNSLSSVVPSFSEVFVANGQIGLFSGAASGPGNLVFFQNDVRADQSTSFFDGGYGYVWSITVEEGSGPVPVPATLALLGLGLAGLGWSRRGPGRPSKA